MHWNSGSNTDSPPSANSRRLRLYWLHEVNLIPMMPSLSLTKATRTCNNPTQSQKNVSQCPPIGTSKHSHYPETKLPTPPAAPSSSWSPPCPPSTRAPPRPSLPPSSTLWASSQTAGFQTLTRSGGASASRLHGAPPLRLPVIVIIPVITICGGCRRGGEARDEMNMGEDRVGRDKREVHRGVRYQGR
jgi:hypothetical protein